VPKALVCTSPFRFLALKYPLSLLLLCLQLGGVCLVTSLAHAETSLQAVNGVSFSCTATPQKNINGVPVASLVEVLVRSEAPKRMTMKFNVIIASDKGQSFTTGHNNGQVGKPIMPQDSYKVPYTPFGKAGPQDEFPKTCQIVDLQVCPYYPAKLAKPTSAGVPAYYDAFHQGVPAEGCRNAVNLPYVDLPLPHVQAGCTALVLGFSDGTNWWTQYGTFVRPFYVHGASTQEDAVAQANSQAQSAGFKVFNDANYHPYNVQCEAPHGVVVGLRKPHRTNNNPVTYEPLPPGVFDSAFMVTGLTKEATVQKALQQCGPDPSNSYEIHLKAGITSCDVLDSW
jgi:hypothetical protein